MSRGLALALVVAALSLIPATPATACDKATADLTFASQSCTDYTSTQVEAEKAEDPSAVWRVQQVCKDHGETAEGVCFNADDCTTAAGAPGTRYLVFKDGVRFGTACLSAGEADAVDDPPPVRALVIEAFSRLDWPASPLVVQPPGGRTLVNFDTNFYTTNTKPTDISVTLVESDVVVTARPVGYRWNFGDGASVTTATPGAPYPSLDVTHSYDETEAVVVSVDTQYGDASFTVDDRPPERIASTVWVDGTTQDLEVLEARPELVLR